MTAMAVVLLSMFLLATNTNAVNCAADGTVVTTGEGRRSIRTTIARIRAGVSSRGENATSVHAKVRDATARLVRYLNSSKMVTNLETTGISLSPVMNYSVSVPEVMGYSGANSVSFEVSVSSAGAILDGAVVAGATRILGVEFKATPRVAAQARDNAVEHAVARARAEARAAARAAGRPIGNITSILINDQYHEEPIQANFLQVDGNPLTNDAASTTVLPKELVIRARVTVTFNIV